MPSFIWPRPDITNDPVPKWLCQRLYNLGQRHVHSEASFGGPHNSFLGCYFPITSQYMIKPILRICCPKDPDASLTRQAPIDSFGQYVETDDQPLADFLVCKATADLHEDRPLLIWELKGDDAAASSTSIQKDRYALWLEKYQSFGMNQPETGAASSRVWVGVVGKGEVAMHEYALDSSGFEAVYEYRAEVLSRDIHGTLSEIALGCP